MIVGVKGVLESKGDGWLNLALGGVTLRLLVPLSTVQALGEPGDQVSLSTHLVVRDNEVLLYGFATPAELSLFQLLLTVSGVGPRTALSLLSSLKAQSLVESIAAGDEQALSRVSGVGKRNAARIVLELKGKLGLAPADGTVAGGDQQAAVAALTALGYTTTEAVHALAVAVQDPDATFEERVRLALKQLAGSP